MLNNKKGLLQRARIAMLAIVTIISVGGAFAMTPKHSNVLQTWGVLQTNASTYVVTAITASTQYDCEFSQKVCTVRSEATPNPMTHEIPISGAEIASDGTFNKASK
jgi:hypothetical protein